MSGMSSAIPVQCHEGEDWADTGKDRLGAPQLFALSILVKTV